MRKKKGEGGGGIIASMATVLFKYSRIRPSTYATIASNQTTGAMLALSLVMRVHSANAIF
jgi:hypothetical protein